MPVTTKLSLSDNLPLTCSRSGTCCHGKIVNLNPWELGCLAEEIESVRHGYLLVNRLMLRG